MIRWMRTRYQKKQKKDEKEIAKGDPESHQKIVNLVWSFQWFSGVFGFRETWKPSLKGWFQVVDLDKFLWFLLVSVGFWWFLKFLEYADVWGLREMGSRSLSFQVPGFYRFFWVQKRVKTKMQVYWWRKINYTLIRGFMMAPGRFHTFRYLWYKNIYTF